MLLLRQRAGVVLAGLFLLGAAACGSKPATPTAEPLRDGYADLGLTARDFGWAVQSPESQGISSAELLEALDFASDAHLNLHSFLLVKRGTVVLDASFFPYLAYTRHDLASITKSVTGTLVGLALAGDARYSLGTTALSLFPSQTPANLTPDKLNMRLRDLLTMRSGLSCSSDLVLLDMLHSKDWVRFTFDLPMNGSPGDEFQYCSSGAHLLSATVRAITGGQALSLATDRLFAPLGITDVVWPLDPLKKDNHGWGDLELSPYDVAKLGQVYLNQGSWHGTPLLAEGWSQSAVTRSVEFTNNGYRTGYGYLWWTHPQGFWGIGRGGQRWVMFPQRKMMLVITAGIQEQDEPALDEFIFKKIVAADHGAPLPPAIEAEARLSERIASVRRETTPAAKPVRAGAPEQEVSGKKYRLDDNLLGLRTFQIDFHGRTARLTLDLADGETMSFIVGLDGRPRYSPGRYGVLGSAVGEWSGDDKLVLLVDEIGNINRWEMSARFSADRTTVMLSLVEKTGLPPSLVRGVTP